MTTAHQAPRAVPTHRSPGAIELTREAAWKVVHCIDSTPEQHEEAIANLTEIARRELLPSFREVLREVAA